VTDAPRITAEDFARLLHETIPLSRSLRFEVEALGPGWARLRLPGTPDSVRAGGTVSGPTLMTLADTAFYAAVLTRIGLEPMAVTSDLSIRFLRRPPPEDLRAEARVLRLGRRQAVLEARLWSGEDEGRLVAHATGTYALPAVG
jgi:uncharacterized protein (TIGR00369 family)